MKSKFWRANTNWWSKTSRIVGKQLHARKSKMALSCSWVLSPFATLSLSLPLHLPIHISSIALSLCRPSLVPCLQQSNSQCHAPVRHEGESLVPRYPTTLPYLYPLLCTGRILPDFLCCPDHIPSPVGRRYQCHSHPASNLSLCQRSPAPCLGRTQHGHHSL